MIKILIKASLLVLFVSGVEANLPGVVDKPLYDKYLSSAVNLSSLVERDGIKYQVNSTKPFSGRFIGYEDDFGLCVNEAGSYKNGLLHGPYEFYEGCGILYSYKTAFKNGLEHGRYIEFSEGYLTVEGNMVNGLAEGEWIGYEYGLISWIEDVKNDMTVSITEFSYYDNGQIETKDLYNDSGELHGISETYHRNGQLKSKIKYKNGSVERVIERYDFNGNPLPL
jgi:antitoxin component YwqK of YwqJK toxin-antitoxin module